MKILQVITSLETGGAEKLITDIAPLLREKGYQVDILIFNGKQTFFKTQLEKAGFKVHSLGKENSFVYHPLYIFKLIPFLRSYDIIHTHNTACQYFAALAKFLCVRKARLVTTEHNTTNRRRKINGFRPLDRFIYHFYEAIISISDKTTEFLKAYIGDKRNIYTILNGINIITYQNAVAVNKQSLCSGDSILVTMVAGFREQKDQDTVIRSLALLPENYTLCLVGDGIRRPICEVLTADLHLQKRVNFLGIRNDVPQLLKASDIVVMSSHWEGFGLAAVEGMAAGKPVLASDVDGLAQVVEGAGLLFPQGDAAALTSMIQKLMNDKVYYQQVAEKCLQRASDYDIRKTVNGYEEIYNTVCGTVL